MFLHLCDSIHWGVSVEEGRSLSRGDSGQLGLCQGGEGSLYPRGFLSKEVSVGGRGLCMGGSLSGGSLSGGSTVKSERYASYWNAFLFQIK